jgi:hypothetical protein
MKISISNSNSKSGEPAPDLTVTGGIKDLYTGKEFHWNEGEVDKALKDLKTLRGTRYGVDWKFAKGVKLNEGKIYFPLLDKSYSGKNAVADFLKEFREKPIKSKIGVTQSPKEVIAFLSAFGIKGKLGKDDDDEPCVVISSKAHSDFSKMLVESKRYNITDDKIHIDPTEHFYDYFRFSNSRVQGDVSVIGNMSVVVNVYYKT